MGLRKWKGVIKITSKHNQRLKNDSNWAEVLLNYDKDLRCKNNCLKRDLNGIMKDFGLKFI